MPVRILPLKVKTKPPRGLARAIISERPNHEILDTILHAAEILDWLAVEWWFPETMRVLLSPGGRGFRAKGTADASTKWEAAKRRAEEKIKEGPGKNQVRDLVEWVQSILAQHHKLRGITPVKLSQATRTLVAMGHLRPKPASAGPSREYALATDGHAMAINIFARSALEKDQNGRLQRLRFTGTQNPMDPVVGILPYGLLSVEGEAEKQLMALAEGLLVDTTRILSFLQGRNPESRAFVLVEVAKPNAVSAGLSQEVYEGFLGKNREALNNARKALRLVSREVAGLDMPVGERFSRSALGE